MKDNIINGNKQRLNYIDIARGICMFSIVMGHMGVRNIDRIVFTYHIPIFYLISGFFSKKEDFKTFIVKRIRTLIVPYYIASLGIMCAYVLIGLLKGTEKGCILEGLIRYAKATLYAAGDNWTSPITIPGIGPTWFLWAMFFGGLIFQVILRIKPEIRLLICVLLLVMADFSAKNLFFLPLDIQPACTSVIFMYFGYIWKCYDKCWDSINSEIKALLLSMSMFIWINFIQNFANFWLVHSAYGRGIIDIVSSLCAASIVLFISKELLDRFNVISSFLGYIGRYSILFLVIHSIELNVIPYNALINKIFRISNESIMMITILLIKIIGISLMVVLFSRISVIRTVFGIREGKK